MSQVSNQQVVDLFKRVYGDLHNLLPQDFPLHVRSLSLKAVKSVTLSLKHSSSQTKQAGPSQEQDKTHLTSTPRSQALLSNRLSSQAKLF
jgi:hypothetical protein